MSINALFPQPIFATSCGERDGFPVVAVMNTALARYNSCADFSWLVELEIVAEATDDRGFPTLEEVDHLDAIADQLEQAISVNGAHFIARQTWKGRRMIDYYVTDGPATRQRVMALVQKGVLSRSVTIQASKDGSWATWMPTLIRMCEPSTEGAACRDQFDHEVLVRIPLNGGEFGSDAEQDDVLALVDELSAVVADSDACELDGYEFGNAEAVLFAYGTDADALWDTLEPVLRGTPVARGAVITKRYGRADDPNAREQTVTL